MRAFLIQCNVENINDTVTATWLSGSSVGIWGSGHGGRGTGGAQMSTVLHISPLQREVMSVSRKHSKIFKWALRRKGVLRWGLVEDIKKGRRLFSGRQFWPLGVNCGWVAAVRRREWGWDTLTSLQDTLVPTQGTHLGNTGLGDTLAPKLRTCQSLI